MNRPPSRWRSRLRWLARVLTLGGLGFAVLFVVSLQGNLYVRGETIEIGVESAALSVNRAIPPNKILPLMENLDSHFVRRPLRVIRWWIAANYFPQRSVHVIIPLWLLTLVCLASGSFLLYRTRGPGRLRRAALALGSSPWGARLLAAATLLALAAIPIGPIGIRIGKASILSVGRGGLALGFKDSAVNAASSIPVVVSGPFKSREIEVLEEGDYVWWFKFAFGAPTPSPWPGWAMEKRIEIPVWLPFAICAGTGAWLCRRALPRPGHCPLCQYNLTGLPPDSPCPECGHIQPASPAHRP